MDESFRDFVQRSLSPAINQMFVERMLLPEPFENYFRRAFVEKTFLSQVAAGTTRNHKEQPFNYEVLEKLGDRILGAVFQLYLFDIMGDDVHVPQTYSDMEKYLLSKSVLADIVEKMGFLRWLQTAEGVPVTQKMKSDLFESFVGAITIAADKYIPEAPGMGLVLSKVWLYQVFNTYIRDKIDPQNPAKYVDNRTKINEIWLFNKWGDTNYIKSGESRGTDQKGVNVEAGINVMAPNTKSFPAALRGLVIGRGYGPTIDIAKERAAEDALATLRINFSEMEDVEVEFDNLKLGRLEKLLGEEKSIFRQVAAIIKAKPNTYKALSVKTKMIYHQYHALLRVKGEDDVWENGERAYSVKSEADAIKILFIHFITNASKSLK